MTVRVRVEADERRLGCEVRMRLRAYEGEGVYEGA